MTEKQKKWAIIITTVIIGIIILLMGRKASGATIVNQQEMPPINVTIPSLNIPERSPIAITIPGLPSYTPYQYSAISPCMCNGGASTNNYQGPLVEFVTNQGSTGPTIYNYSTPSTSSNSSFVGVPWYGSGG